jgi:hypothetical protein
MEVETVQASQMAKPQFSYSFDEQTRRWDVVWNRPDGTALVVRAYATEAEAAEHVELANNPPAVMRRSHG